MTRMLALPVDRPRATVIAVAIGTVVLALAISRLELDPSAEGFMASRDPARAYYEHVRQEFGSDSLTLVVVEADDVFAEPALAAIRRLSDALQELDGVARVDSLTTVKNIKGSDGGLDTSPLVGRTLRSDIEALNRIRRDALDNPVLVKHLVSADGRTTAIAIFTDAPGNDKTFNHRFVANVDQLIAREVTRGFTVYQVGEPLLKATYFDYLVNDLTRLIPLAFVVLFGTVFLTMRSGVGVLVPAVTSAVTLVWGAGLMGLSHIPINALTAAIPPLLVTIGVTEDIHLISACRQRVERGAAKIDAIRGALHELSLPVAVTSATTIIGFGSLILSDVTMLSQFGAASALALGANYVVTMALVPSLLCLLPFHPVQARASTGRLDRWIEASGWFTLRHRIGILVAVTAITLIAAAGLWLLPVDTDFINYFPRDSAVPVRAKRVHERLAGSATFYIVVETQRDDGILDPDVLRRIDALQRFAAAHGADATLSVVDYLRKVHRELNAADGVADGALPATREQAAQYLLLLERRDLDRLITSDGRSAVLLVRHNLTGSARLRILLRELEGFASREFPPTARVRPTGEAILINNAADYMAMNELTSFSLAFVVIGLIHTVLFLSPAAGALSLVPNVIPIVLIYGLMGFLQIPLNTGTAMIATIAIGISVDDTVHHIVTYSRQLREDYVPSLAMFNTLREVTPPLVHVTFALTAGFLVMLGSGFVPLRQFGVLASVTMVLGLACEMFVTPALFGASRPILVWELAHLRTDPRIFRSSPLLAGLSEWQMRLVLRLASLSRVSEGRPVRAVADGADGIFVVLSGRARAGDRAIEPGAVFGRYGGRSVLAGPERTIATTPLELIELDSAALKRLRRLWPASRRTLNNLTRLTAPTEPRITPPAV